MIKPVVHVRALSPYRVVCVLAVLMLLLLPSLVAASPASSPPDPGDLGDAPDSTNHAGAAMTAYPGVPANFPSVADPAAGFPSGPFHHSPGADSWLGAAISAEQDADLMPDADGMTNIIPPANNPDNDWFDDGVQPVNPNGILLPQCQQTDFRYIVTGATTVITHPVRVNVWFDFNRDGDWADILQCVTPAGAAVNVPEWSVQNQVVPVVPGSRTRITPPFRSFHPAGNCPIWMRITLSGQPAPLAGGMADGRGPLGGYQIGETEDYYLVPQLGGGGQPPYFIGD